MRPGSRTPSDVVVVDDRAARQRRDQLATEEPLEIRIGWRDRTDTVAVTMRTPGHDFELAVGFLFSEGVISGRDDVRAVRYCTDAEQLFNVVTVDLADHVEVELTSVVRRTTVSSACGVCGVASIEALATRGCAPLPDGPELDLEVLYRLPDALRAAQGVFRRTGGLHACGLFTPTGGLVAVREDIGRHNAVDAVVGWALLEGRLPLHDQVMVVSGRAGFEIVHKAVAAGVPVVAAIGAPSSLAVATAQRFGVTLVGFLRGRRCNLYSAPHRIRIGEERG